MKTIAKSLLLLGVLCTAGNAQDRVAAARASRLSTPFSAPTLSGLPASPGWARGAEIWGYASAVFVLAAGIASEDAVLGEDGIIVGSVGTAYFAITVPLLAIGASSARKSGVHVKPAWRIVGWSGYGATLIASGFFVGLALNDVAIDGGPSATGVLGAATCIMMALDAHKSASAASSSASARVAPTLNVVSVRGKTAPALGMQVRF